MEEMYKEKYRFDQAIYTLVLSPEGELRLNGEPVDGAPGEMELLL
jgi:hypothetical protein